MKKILKLAKSAKQLQSWNEISSCLYKKCV